MSKILFFLLIIFMFSSLNSDEWLGKDKIAHFTYSAYLTYWSYGYSKDILKYDNSNAFYFSLSVPLSLGFLKELSDKKIKKTGWSWKDITYDVFGIVAGSIIIARLN